jgi:hypothetical protein
MKKLLAILFCFFALGSFAQKNQGDSTNLQKPIIYKVTLNSGKI